MAALQELFHRLDQSLQQDASYFTGVEAVFQVQFHDDDAVYQIIVNGEDCKVVEGAKEPADCTLIFVTEDFEKATKGELNGTEAFMSGRLKIKGDKGLALKIQDYISKVATVSKS